MAMRACSLNSSSTLLSVPALQSSPPSKPSVQILCSTTPSIPSLVRHSSRTVSEAPGVMPEALVIANAIVSAGFIVQKTKITQPENGLSGGGRRRRRKRKKDHELDDSYSTKYLLEGCSSQSERSSYLTRKEEGIFSCYLKEAAVLEAAAGSIIQTGRSESSGTRIGACAVKRMEAEKMLLRARECRERIVLSYKRLVISIAIAYQGKGLSLQDLIQEGCIGLLRGAQRFDSTRGNKLSTYVYWWIKQAIIRAVAKKSRLVRLPGNLCDAAAKVAQANSSLRRQLGRFPTYDEIAENTDLSVPSVQLLSGRCSHPISMNQPVRNKEMKLEDIIPGPEEARPETMVNREVMLQDLEKLLKRLSSREEYIIRLHYGLNGERARSCDEIGRMLKLSRERVRQIHCSALSRLREEKDLVESLRQFMACQPM